MPRLLLISGPPGIGKSTLAKSLAKASGFMILDKDAVDEPFSPNDRGEHYSTSIEPKSISALLNLAHINLSVGHSVILDLPWTHVLEEKPYLKAELFHLVAELNLNLLVVELFLDPDLLRQRITSRGLKRDQEKLSEVGWKSFVTRDKITSRISLHHFAIDASLSREEILQRALGFLNNN